MVKVETVEVVVSEDRVKGLVKEYLWLKNEERKISSRLKEIRDELFGVMNKKNTDKFLIILNEVTGENATVSRVTAIREYVDFKRLPEEAKQQLREAGYVKKTVSEFIRISRR